MPGKSKRATPAYTCASSLADCAALDGSADASANRQLGARRRQCKAQKEELHRCQKDIRRLKKQLRTYEIILKLRQSELAAEAPPVHQCGLCEKQFESAYYLEMHLNRRHDGQGVEALRAATSPSPPPAATAPVRCSRD
jgi:hypothetical protein